MSLLFLSLQNLMRRTFRTSALLLAIAIVSGAIFSTTTLMWGVNSSLKRGLSKFGADLLAVPKGSMVSMKSALLTGEPSLFYMERDIMQTIAGIKGVKKVSPQLFLTSVEGTCCIMGNAFLIGFDPESDFTVLPWIEEKMGRPLREDDVIVGGANAYAPGDKIFFYGQNFTVYGKLGRTGVGLYDNALFITMERAYSMAEESHKTPGVVPLKLVRGQISAALVQTDMGAKLPYISFTISKDPNIKVITAGNIITSVRQNLVALFGSTLILSVVLIIANALMISAIFSTIVNERKRELGLLRAIGARKVSIFRLIVYEAALLTSAGGVLGVIVGIVIMRVYQRTILFNLKELNMPYLWPPVSSIVVLACIAIGAAVLVGVGGAFYPAVKGSKLPPYDAIRAGE
ncbi:MAG: ABC transporter permease [Alphaproteobacteria bacterium]|uniref:ABC transporter permease n=1 Tax=Candidatus Nitrobium versatile TaxID=2884831 RepID=A0A953J2J1_9BACT|nr:ABC transporter permease [Candidatus Nitrobium versatile]